MDRVAFNASNLHLKMSLIASLLKVSRSLRNVSVYTLYLHNSTVYTL